MRRGFQLALFGGGVGRGQLFGLEVLRQYLRDHSRTKIPHLEARLAALRGWLDAISDTKATESTLEGGFVAQVLVNVLGYTPFPGAAGEKPTLYVKPGSRLTGIPGTPDVTLGRFTETAAEFDAVLESKTPGTDLDRPQPRAGGASPVEQAFGYGTQILGVRWVIVSDMVRIRLYSVESDAEYEEIDLRRCLVPGSLEPEEEFDRLYWLLHARQLLGADDASPVGRLHSRTAAEQLRIREGFYDAYYRIRADLHAAVREASKDLPQTQDEDALLSATQRLLDRLLFLYYCEDHPEQLIPHNTVRDLVLLGARMPGAGQAKIYRMLKELFREVDQGSPPGSGLNVLGYNGELFKQHPIIDVIDLPDSLARKKYVVSDRNGAAKVIEGVWGLHAYDFWRDLNEHLLGHIFEESLSDLVELRSYDPAPVGEKLRERKRHGIFYTSSLLADFLSGSAVQALLDERAPRAGGGEDLEITLARRREAITSLRIIDVTCGSGAFLVSAYRELLFEYWRTVASAEALDRRGAAGTLDVFDVTERVSQAALLRDCLFGIDLLPQATEIAKLALWLRSSRKGEKVSDLSHNIVAGDALDLEAALGSVSKELGGFDLVIGNPPWGAEMDESNRLKAVHLLGLSAEDDWDSWELFTLLGMSALRRGGRLAYVLPDSFLYPAKARLRARLAEMGTIEKVLNLGPDWFGPEVRMSTVLVQLRRGDDPPPLTFRGTLLAGRLRRDAIAGRVPLKQVEAQRTRELPTIRTTESDGHPIEVFRGRRDDEIIEKMSARSDPLSAICDRGRGEEINKTGLLWTCPNCMSVTTPGLKRKGGGYHPKTCPTCGLELTEGSISEENLIADRPGGGDSAPYVDGDDITQRYARLRPSKWIRLDQEGWAFKHSALYEGDKIVLRQAGVGIVATLDHDGCYVPQSVYVYRIKPEVLARGVRHEFVLAALVSRTMTYLVFKRFAEIDPAKAHAKLTHTRLADLPIPRVDFQNPEQAASHASVCEAVGRILAGESGLGSKDDLRVELELRKLWGLTADDGAYINGEFFDLPESQVVRDLFPSGPPAYRQ
jgi:hypothetical protein